MSRFVNPPDATRMMRYNLPLTRQRSGVFFAVLPRPFRPERILIADRKLPFWTRLADRVLRRKRQRPSYNVTFLVDGSRVFDAVHKPLASAFGTRFDSAFGTRFDIGTLRAGQSIAVEVEPRPRAITIMSAAEPANGEWIQFRNF